MATTDDKVIALIPILERLSSVLPPLSMGTVCGVCGCLMAPAEKTCPKCRMVLNGDIHA